MYMVFEGKHAVKFHTNNVEVGTSGNGNPREDQVTMGRVCRPRSANNNSLSFVIIQYYAPAIAPLLNPSQVPVKGAATAALPAGLRTTVSMVESLAYA